MKTPSWYGFLRIKTKALFPASFLPQKDVAFQLLEVFSIQKRLNFLVAL